jgi:deoxyribonuclease-4
MPLLGAHLSVAGGLARAIERGEALGCEAIQIFTRNRLQWKNAPVSLAEAESFHRAWRASTIRAVVSHASYLINLAGSPEIRARSLEALACEIERCSLLDIPEIVLHPGFGEGDEARARIASGLEEVLSRTEGERVRVLLETMAGQGNGVGAEPEDFARILDALDRTPRVGICVDLCHLFAAGVDLRAQEGFYRVMSALERRFGLERIGCFHLSDSRAERGSRVDRHAHLGQGEMGLSPFAALMGDRRFDAVPAILETPKDGVGDEGNLALLRKLRGG